MLQILYHSFIRIPILKTMNLSCKIPLCYPFLNFKNHGFKLKMSRSLLFENVRYDSLQVNPYYSVTLCDKIVHVLSSHCIILD